MTELTLKEELDLAEEALEVAEEFTQIALDEETKARHVFLVAYSKWVNAGRPE